MLGQGRGNSDGQISRILISKDFIQPELDASGGDCPANPPPPMMTETVVGLCCLHWWGHNGGATAPRARLAGPGVPDTLPYSEYGVSFSDSRLLT